jgi:hypothetical protein
MYWWQVGGFIRDADVRRKFVPLLYQLFDATPSARPAFFRLNEDLLPMFRSRTHMISKLKGFRRPVRIIFGDADPSLNSGVARTIKFITGTLAYYLPDRVPRQKNSRSSDESRSDSVSLQAVFPR